MQHARIRTQTHHESTPRLVHIHIRRKYLKKIEEINNYELKYMWEEKSGNNKYFICTVRSVLHL